MRRKSQKMIRKVSTGKVMTGILLGGVVSAALGWLMSPVAGATLRRWLRGEVTNVRDRHKTAAGNVESRVRELAEEIGD